jgi:hypothetical protein
MPHVRKNKPEPFLHVVWRRWKFYYLTLLIITIAVVICLAAK